MNDFMLLRTNAARMLFRLKSSARISSPFSIKILMPLMKGLCVMIFFPAVSHAGELGGTHMVWVQVCRGTHVVGSPVYGF